MADFEFISHKDEVLKEFKRKVELALEAIGSSAEGYAAKNCPVDTGRLRNSIGHNVQEEEGLVVIGTNVEYAVYVETDDRKHHTNGKAHFLRDAAATHTSEYEALCQTILKE